MRRKEIPSRKVRNVNPGDVFAIPLGANQYAAGIVLHISRRFRNGMLAGYFDVCYTSIEAIAIDELEPNFAFTPNYTSVRLVKEGDWPLLGTNSALLQKATIPVLVSVATLYHKDEVVGQLGSAKEGRDYETLEGQGQVFVENRLRKHFESIDCISAN